jgi:hypothetical protein
MKIRLISAVLFIAALFYGEAQANSLLISPNPNLGEKFALQGDCSNHGINPAETPNVAGLLRCFTADAAYFLPRRPE